MELQFEALLPPVQNSIKKLIEKENFIQHDIVIRNLNTGGNNFLSKLYGIDIKGVTLECNKEINIFVKEKIVLEKLTTVNMEHIFANEEFIYKELSNILTSLQDQANVPPEDRYKIAEAYDETSNDAIILENLCDKGFVSNKYDKTKSASLEFLEIGIQSLAKFHALSFVIENKMPEYFKEKISKLENSFNFDETWQVCMRKVCSHVANLYDNEVKKKIENFIPVLLEKTPKYLREKTKIRTLSHGDYRMNNLMFRIVDGEPVDVVPVDYQLIDYGCPIRDLLYFIFLGTDQEFRRNHLMDLKELYFVTLTRFLRYFDMDVETVYPRREFEKLYTEWLDFGLMMTLFLTVVEFAPETGLDFQTQSSEEMPYCPDKKYNCILRGLVDDFVQWGYL